MAMGLHCGEMLGESKGVGVCAPGGGVGTKMRSKAQEACASVGVPAWGSNRPWDALGTCGLSSDWLPPVMCDERLAGPP